MFFPAVGNCNNGSVNNVGSNGNYWSSSLNTSNVINGWNLNFNSGNCNMNNNNRYNGFPVRAVFGQHLSCSIFATNIAMFVAFLCKWFIYVSNIKI